MRVAAVDDDVTLLEVGQHLGDERVDRRTGLDHQHHFPRPLEMGTELLDGLRAEELLAGIGRDEVVDLAHRAIEHRDAVSMVFHVEHKVLAHHGETDQTDIVLVAHLFSFVAAARRENHRLHIAGPARNSTHREEFTTKGTKEDTKDTKKK